MIYHVSASFRTELAGQFLQELGDGSIAAQRPDGAEIVASMNRAVIGANGRTQWSEMCFCDPPLAHERATVLDTYFDDMRIEPVGDYESYDGRPFMEYLRRLVEKDA